MVCPMCIAAPIAIGSAFGVIASRKHLHLYNISLAITLIALFVMYYFRYLKECKACQPI